MFSIDYRYQSNYCFFLPSVPTDAWHEDATLAFFAFFSFWFTVVLSTHIYLEKWRSISDTLMDYWLMNTIKLNMYLHMVYS
jgi:hypothetical protein